MSIQNYLNKIKDAVFGKDIREAIYASIKQCYDDASVNHDNANMEVKFARGTHSTLNERLNVDESEIKTIEARISNIISKNNTTEGNSELVDVRTGTGGTIFGSAGSHVRSIEKGNIKNVKSSALATSVYENTIENELICNVTSGEYSNQIHGAIQIAIPFDTIQINSITTYCEFESKTGNIISVQQRCQAAGVVGSGTIHTDTFIELNDAFSYNGVQANSIALYIWPTFNAAGVKGSYSIKNLMVNINGIEYNPLTMSNVTITYPFNAKGTIEKKENKYYGLVTNKNLNILNGLKKRIFGEDGYIFNGHTKIDITNCYGSSNSYMGFIKNNHILNNINVNTIRVKCKFLCYDSLNGVTPVVEISNANGLETLVKNQIYKFRNGNIVEIDHTFTPVKNNISATRIGVYIRTHLSENIKHTFEIGDFEVYINDELITNWKGWENAFSTGVISSGKFAATKEDIKGLMDVVSPLKGKTIMFFGDSIMDTYTHTTRTPYWVCNLTGAIQKNYAVSSSGYSMNAVYSHPKWGTENTNVPAMIQRSVVDGIIPDYIVIAAGTNDWDFQRKPFGTFADALMENPTINTFYGALGLTIKTVLKHYPLAKILFVTPLPRKQLKGSGTQHTVKPNGKTVIDYSNAIIEVCKYFSMNYLHLTENSGFNLDSDVALQTFMSDGLHPTEKGAKERHAPRIIKALEEM